MGVDHGGTRGISPRRTWSRGTLVQIVPLGFLSYRYKKERSVVFKIRQNPFSAGPGPRWGSSRRSPDPLVGWRGDTPHHTPTPFGTDPLSALAMRPPQNSNQIYAYALRPRHHACLRQVQHKNINLRQQGFNFACEGHYDVRRQM